MRSIGVFMACAGMLLSLTAAYGLPKQIIILRHAEKTDTGGLCSVGEGRKNALVAQYLGKGAKDSLFVSGEQPAAFYAITGHTKETIEPAANTWPGVPLKFPGKVYKWRTILTPAVTSRSMFVSSSFTLRHSPLMTAHCSTFALDRGTTQLLEQCDFSGISQRDIIRDIIMGDSVKLALADAAKADPQRYQLSSHQGSLAAFHAGVAHELPPDHVAGASQARNSMPFAMSRACLTPRSDTLAPATSWQVNRHAVGGSFVQAQHVDLAAMSDRGSFRSPAHYCPSLASASLALCEPRAAARRYHAMAVSTSFGTPSPFS